MIHVVLFSNFKFSLAFLRLAVLTNQARDTDTVLSKKKDLLCYICKYKLLRSLHEKGYYPYIFPPDGEIYVREKKCTPFFRFSQRNAHSNRTAKKNKSPCNILFTVGH